MVPGPCGFILRSQRSKHEVCKNAFNTRDLDRKGNPWSAAGRALFDAAREGRYWPRDSTLLLILFSHRLRLTEALMLTFRHVDMDHGITHVKRRKGGVDGDYKLRGRQIRALRNGKLAGGRQLTKLFAATTSVRSGVAKYDVDDGAGSAKLYDTPHTRGLLRLRLQ
jgi:integrase